jgi:dodecin
MAASAQRDATDASYTLSCMSVYKVIDIIGTSPTSWEQAAAEAVQRARESVDDIRVARVIEQDMSVDGAGKITYRIKLEVSFKMRPPRPS